MEIVLQFMAMISTILGFMNILPIPGLDGGHALITIIEGLARREIPFKVKMIINIIHNLQILLLKRIQKMKQKIQKIF